MLHEKNPETTKEPCGPRMTSSQLATLYGLSRDQAEALLVRLGLRGPTDDGQTTYAAGDLARLLAEEDRARLAAAVETLASFTENSGLAARIVEGIVAEETERWIAENGMYEGIVALKAKLLTGLRKTHRFQTARRSGDAAAELAALQDFGAGLLDAISEQRRGEKL